MRAVNLIPADLRRGSSAAGRTGSSVYVLLGVLGVLVVLATAWSLAGRQVTDRKNDLVRVETEAQRAEVRAGALQAYTTFAELRDKRVQTVTSLSRSRFNWPYALREVSRVIPGDVWLTTLVGTVAPGVSVDGASGGANSLRGALAVPAVELTGCTTNMENVARYLARLRSIDGVTRVSLASSEKADAPAAPTGSPAAPAAGGSSPSGDCRSGSDQWPKFEAVVFFERSTATAAGAASGAAPVAAPAPAGGSTGTTPPSSAATPASGSTATPSSATPTSGTAPSTGSTK